MSILRRKLNEIFLKVQIGSSQIHLKRLQNLYHESNFKEFVQEFLKVVNICVETKNEQNPLRDKLLTFLSKFCTSLKKPTEDEETLCPFLTEIFLHLFKEFNPDVISTYRVTQLIELLLKEIGEQESFLDEEICIQIRDLMLERIDDVKAKVRIEAIKVLQRLQDPLDNNDVIIRAFIERLNDDNSQVRKHIVQCIGLNTVSIPIVVGRCLDVSEEVRLVSYDKLSKIPMKALKIAHRQFILRNGFADKSPKVKNFILKTLLPQWLSTYNGDYFQLIRALKLDADEKDFKQTTTLVEKVLQELFKNTEITTIMEALPLGKEKLISTGEIQWEEILFWRCLQQFLRNQDNENDYVDKILPELIFFCDYVTNVDKSKIHLKSDWETIQHEHIIFELLKICHDYDFADEVGRITLQKLVTNFLIDGPTLYEVTDLLVRMFEKLIPNTDERMTKFCEIITEIQSPMEPVRPSEDIIRKKNVKIAELRLKLNIAEDKQEKAIEKEDYDKAAELKREISSLKEKMTVISKEFEETNQQRVPKTDTNTVCKCLDILTASLQNEKIRTLPEPYRAFQDIFLPPLLHSRQAEIFHKSLKLLSFFACYDEKLAKESMKVFFAPLLAHKFQPVCGDPTISTAICCISDMLLTHGSKIFDDEDSTSNLSQKPNNKRRILDRTTIDETVYNEPPPPSLELVIEVLSELLDDIDDQIKETAATSLITLMLTGRVRSPPLFSKLLLKWFSPSTSKYVRLRQMIGKLFTDYVPENPYSLEVIEQAFVPTLQAIIDAPKSSPLADIDVDSIGRFLAALSQPGRHKYNVGLDAHKNIALILCKEICERPNNKRTLIYLKTLLYLEPVRDDDITLDILRKQVDAMQELIKEKSALRYVYKYRHLLDNDLTHNENTTSGVSLSTVPESTVTANNSMNIETENDCEASSSSALSVKRRKRNSKANGEQNNGNILRLNRNLEQEKQNGQVVISETDSEYATENERNGHKKNEDLNPKDQQPIVEIFKKPEEPIQDKDTNSQNEPIVRLERNTIIEKMLTIPTEREKQLTISIMRNDQIDKMCLEKPKKSSTRNENKSIDSKNSEKHLTISVIRNNQIDKMCLEKPKMSSPRDKKQSPVLPKSPVEASESEIIAEERTTLNNSQNSKRSAESISPIKKKNLRERPSKQILTEKFEENISIKNKNSPNVKASKKVFKKRRSTRLRYKKK